MHDPTLTITISSLCSCLCAPDLARPFAVWDASSGVVMVDDTVALNWGKAEVQWAISSLADKLSFHSSLLLKEVRFVELACGRWQ